MKIGHPAEKHTLPVAPTQPTATDPAKAVQGTATAVPTAVAADASAQVELSSTASTLLSSGGSAEFDANKVGHISNAIAAGTFKVNPEAIADKLIANAQELLGKVHGG